MRQASRISTQFYDKKLRPTKIKITQFTILSLIASGEGKTVNSLSESLLMDRTTLTRSLDVLKKLIEDNPTITLDGELYNHELKSDFQKIVSLVRKVKCRPEEIAESAELVEYHIYDMFDADNPDMPFIDRMYFLVKHLPVVDKIVVVETAKTDTTADIDKMYGEYTEAGYEGQMVRQNTAYECKRSKNLLKRKEFITEEFEVVNVEEGNGNWSGYAKRFVLKMPNGTQFSSGIRGSQAKLKIGRAHV